MHGYGHPWAGGANVNILPQDSTSFTTNIGTWYSLTGDMASNPADGTKITLAADTYFFDVFNKTNIGNHQLIKFVPETTVLADSSNKTFTLTESTDVYIRIQKTDAGAASCNSLLKKGSSSATWTPYSNICPISGRTGTTVSTRNADNTETASATISFGTTVYGGQVDFKTGNVTVEWEYIASYNGETLPGEWISDRDAYASGTTPTTDAEVCYELATPTTLSLTPDILTMLKNNNSVSGDGVITITALTGDSWS